VREDPHLNITAKSKYAVIGLVELAQRSNGGPVPLGEVAESRGIPAGFLEQLFATLRKGGVLCSDRGAHGGFRFDRPVDRVTVLDVVQLLDGPLGAALCTVSDDCELRPLCAAGDVWLQAKLATEEVLAGTTIQDLAEWEKAKKMAASAVPSVKGGGDGGHKGVRSIADSLRFRDFIRVRLGIGRPPEGMTAEAFVLSSFPSSEAPVVKRLIDLGVQATKLIVTDGIERARNTINTIKDAEMVPLAPQ